MSDFEFIILNVLVWAAPDYYDDPAHTPEIGAATQEIWIHQISDMNARLRSDWLLNGRRVEFDTKPRSSCQVWF